MSDENKKRFLVLYQVPAAVLDDWGKTDPEVRRSSEEKLRGEWADWMRNHASMISSTDAAGKTKRVSSAGVSDARNDIMLCSFVEAESHEAATKAFETHPHLQIPQSFIEVTELRPMGQP